MRRWDGHVLLGLKGASAIGLALCAFACAAALAGEPADPVKAAGNAWYPEKPASKVAAPDRASARVALPMGGSIAAESGAPGPQVAQEQRSPGTTVVPIGRKVFKADPSYADKPYDAKRQLDIYGAKYDIKEPRPVLEIGRPQYMEGPFRHGTDVVGRKNLLFSSLTVFGDWRTAIAMNDLGQREVAQLATRLNLDVDWKFTATERIHAFFRPLDRKGDFTRWEFGGPNADHRPKVRLDFTPQTLFFEGDIGAIAAGLSDSYKSFDLPIAFGLTPFLFQNGIWVDDAMVGFGFAIPSLNSRLLNISNMDLTFFSAFHDVSSAALVDKNGQLRKDNARLYGAAAFVEALEGYFEFGVGYVDGHDVLRDLDYVNATAAFTRRYWDTVSNSLRVVWNTGQKRSQGNAQTADGFAVLFESSLVTAKPYTLVPYLNGFIGFDRPQPLARDAGTGGILKNTGINFETDGLTGFPTLDATAQNTWGGALGVNYLFNLDQQIVLEAATVQTLRGNKVRGQPAQDAQYAVGMRYQIPLTNDLIFRTDGIYGFRADSKDVAGVRGEVRLKF